MVLSVPGRPFELTPLELDPPEILGWLCFVYEQDKPLSDSNVHLSMGKQSSLGSSAVAKVKITGFRKQTLS